MRKTRVRRQNDGPQAWRQARPPLDAGWPLRLRFVSVVVAFIFCSWAALGAVKGHVSFAWLQPLQQQAQVFVAPFQTPSRGNAFPTVAGGQSPLVQASHNAQGVPTATVPAAAAGNPVVLVSAPTTGPVLPTPTAPARRPLAPTVTVERGRPTAATSALVRATSVPAVAVLATATAAANLAAGPHTLYVVHTGDTLDGIAHRLGVAPIVLAEINHLAPPYKIVVGKALLIPAA